MAFYIGSTSVYPGIIPTPNETNNGGQLYNDGSVAFWAYPGVAQEQVGAGWRYRTILTHGYIAAGYKGYNPWRSVNKTWHQTDTTIYCGEQIDKAAAYLDGTFSDFNAYVHGTSDTWQGSSAHTSSYNLFNGVMRMQNNTNFTFFGSGGSPYGYMGNNPVADGLSYGGGQSSPNSTGGWNMSVNRVAQGCASTPGGNGALPGGAGYIYGGGSSNTDKLYFPSEVMYTTTGSPVTWGTVASCGGQYYAYILGNSNTAGCQYMQWSNDTFTQWSGYSNSYTSDGNNKNLMSKWGWFYCGVAGNTDNRIAKMSDVNQTLLSNMTKLASIGEENMQMGQDWGYSLGNYNGQQNNWTIKTGYATDSQTTMGFTTQPKGHYGTSSGACSSAAASVCAARRT